MVHRGCGSLDTIDRILKLLRNQSQGKVYIYGSPDEDFVDKLFLFRRPHLHYENAYNVVDVVVE